MQWHIFVRFMRGSTGRYKEFHFMCRVLNKAKKVQNQDNVIFFTWLSIPDSPIHGLLVEILSILSMHVFKHAVECAAITYFNFILKLVVKVVIHSLIVITLKMFSQFKILSYLMLI